MTKHRFRDYAWATATNASAVPLGFVPVATGALPAPLAQAVAAQQDLYRQAYEQALEAVASARRTRRWLYRAANTAAWN